MKPYLQAIALPAALAVGLGLAAYAFSARVPHIFLTLPLLVIAIALPTGLTWLFYWPFRSMFIAVPVLATVVLSVAFSSGLSGYLLEKRGERHTATVTAFAGNTAKGGGYLVRLADEDGREFDREFPVRERYALGAHLDVVVDPEGWSEPALATSPRPGAWFPWAAGTAYALVGGLYVAGALRERGRGPG